MQTPRFLRFAWPFVCGALFTGPLQLAAAPVEGLPRLADVAVYRSAENTRHYLLLGRGLTDARRYVVEYTGREARVLALVEDAEATDAPTGAATEPAADTDDSAVTLEFTDGRWFMSPPAFGAEAPIDDDVPAGLIDPLRGRTEFTSVDLTSSVLTQLGLVDHVGPAVTARAAERDRAAARPPRDAHGERISFLQTVFARTEFDVLASLITELGAKGVSLPRATEQTLADDRALLSVWAFDSHVDAVQAVLKEHLGAEATVATRAHHAPQLEREVGQFFATIERNLDQGVKPEPGLAAKIVERIAAVEEWRLEHARVRRELTTWQNGRAAGDAINTGFVRPLAQMVGRGYDLLHRLNTPDAREALMMTQGPVGGRLTYLNRTADASGQTYFAYWLERVRKRVTWAQSTDPKIVAERGARVVRGPALRKFGLAPVYLYAYGRTKDPSPAIPTFPLRALGSRESPRQRAAFVRLVLEGDKAAEYARQYFVDPKHADGPAVGNFELSTLIAALPGEVARHREDPGSSFVPFDRVLYFTQAAQILTELLNTAPMSLINSATLLAVVDAAVRLPDQVKANLDATTTRGLPRLTRSLIELSAALNTWTIQMAYRPHEPGAAAGCQATLAVTGNPS